MKWIIGLLTVLSLACAAVVAHASSEWNERIEENGTRYGISVSGGFCGVMVGNDDSLELAAQVYDSDGWYVTQVLRIAKRGGPIEKVHEGATKDRTIKRGPIMRNGKPYDAFNEKCYEVVHAKFGGEAGVQKMIDQIAGVM